MFGKHECGCVIESAPASLLKVLPNMFCYLAYRVSTRAASASAQQAYWAAEASKLSNGQWLHTCTMHVAYTLLYYYVTAVWCALSTHEHDACCALHIDLQVVSHVLQNMLDRCNAMLLCSLAVACAATRHLATVSMRYMSA